MAKKFLCANKDCHTHTWQLIELSAQELDGCRLCAGCYSRGLRLKQGVVVFRVAPDAVGKKEKP